MRKSSDLPIIQLRVARATNAGSGSAGARPAGSDRSRQSSNSRLASTSLPEIESWRLWLCRPPRDFGSAPAERTAATAREPPFESIDEGGLRRQEGWRSALRWCVHEEQPGSQTLIDPGKIQASAASSSLKSCSRSRWMGEPSTAKRLARIQLPSEQSHPIRWSGSTTQMCGT